jgi:hypothetical protein
VPDVFKTLSHVSKEGKRKEENYQTKIIIVKRIYVSAAIKLKTHRKIFSVFREILCFCGLFFFLVVLGYELRASHLGRIYHLSHPAAHGEILKKTSKWIC